MSVDGAVCAALGDGIVIAGVGIGFGRAHAIFRTEKAVVDPIVADLKTENILNLAAGPLTEECIVRIEANYPAPVLLFKLIALDGVIQVVSEIGEQIEIVIESVSRDR